MHHPNPTSSPQLQKSTKLYKSNFFNPKKARLRYFFRKMCIIYFFRSLKSYIFAVQKISNNIYSNKFF